MVDTQNIDTLGVFSGLDINGCVLSYFEGTVNLHLYKLYTHYFTL